jgi:hypothetical protein
MFRGGDQLKGVDESCSRDGPYEGKGFEFGIKLP